MSSETVKLINDKGEFVEIAKATADELFAHEKKVDDMLNNFLAAGNEGNDDDDDDDDDANNAPAAADAPAADADAADKPLKCSKAALDALKEYAEWPKERRHTDALPKPLQNGLESHLTKDEMAFLKRIEADNILVELLDAALEVQFGLLTEMCAAYASVRVDEIAKEAPNIMEGAERIRKYLGLKNEWTAEEMKHLENEMKVIKELDPSAY